MTDNPNEITSLLDSPVFQAHLYATEQVKDLPEGRVRDLFHWCHLHDRLNVLIHPNDKWSGWKYHSIEGLVLGEGELHNPAPLPERFPQGQKKECFSNAFELAIRNARTLTYCEGYGVSEVGIPLMHGWCVDEDDNVVDPTWDKPEGNLYLGVKLPLRTVLGLLEHNETLPVLDCWKMDYVLLRDGLGPYRQES